MSMNEKILTIKETTFTQGNDEYTTYDGYEITTDKQVIRVGITNYQYCCEQWGYLSSEDDFSVFEGSTLFDVSVTDTALNTKILEGIGATYSGGVMFVNFDTNKGTLQLVAYNAHNGYYGHCAVIVSAELNHSECL